MTDKERQYCEDMIEKYKDLVEMIKEDYDKLMKEADAALLRWEEDYMALTGKKIGEAKATTEIDPCSEMAITIAKTISAIRKEQGMSVRLAADILSEKSPELSVRTILDTMIAVRHQMADDPEWAAITFGDSRGETDDKTKMT